MKKQMTPSAADSFPPEFSPQSRQFYEMRGMSGDIHQAIALELSEGAPAIESVRNQIAKGNLETASQLIAEAAVAAQDSIFDSAELDLESTRLAFYEWRFEDAIGFATQVIERSPWAASRLSAFQLRAACFFEMQRWSEAGEDLQKGEALALLYPGVPVLHNLRALRVRLDLRRNGFEQGRKILTQWLGQTRTSGSLNLDRLHQYERIQLDWLRLHQKNYQNCARKNYLYAFASGEDLFSAAGAFDVWTSLSSADRDLYFNQWVAEARKFARIEKLLLQVQGRSPILTETSRNILNSWAASPEGSVLPAVDTSIPEGVLDLRTGLFVHLRTKSVVSLGEKPQLARSLQLLASGPQEKEQFFQIIWNGLSYDRESRDGAVRSLLLRLRRELGLSILTVNGQITLQDQVWVCE